MSSRLIDIESPAGAQCQPLAQIVQRSNHSVEVPPEDLNVLAERFKELREFSMDVLQGYLLLYKNQSRRAAGCAGKWVREEMDKRESGSSSWKDTRSQRVRRDLCSSQLEGSISSVVSDLLTCTKKVTSHRVELPFIIQTTKLLFYGRLEVPE